MSTAVLGEGEMPDERLKMIAVYQLINIKTGEKSQYYTATYASKYVLTIDKKKQKFVRENDSTLYAVDTTRQPKYVQPMSKCPELIEDEIDFKSKWKLISNPRLQNVNAERNKRIDALLSRKLLK